MTDPNNAQPSRHEVFRQTIGGSLARSWPPPLPRRRCCVLLLLLGLSAAAAAAINRCAVDASAVCSVETFVYFVCVHASCARVRQRTATKARSHQTDDRRLARSWPPPLPRRRRCCVLLLLLLDLYAAANNRCAVFASAVCEC